MNLLLIVIPILAFILFGLIVAIIIPFKIFSQANTGHQKQELSFSILIFIILPILIFTLLINYQLHHNLNTDYHNIIRVGGMLHLYLYTLTPGFLVVAVFIKIITKEDYKLFFWGSLFLAVTLPVILFFFGVPICEFLVKVFWNEDITVARIKFH